MAQTVGKKALREYMEGVFTKRKEGLECQITESIDLATMGNINEYLSPGLLDVQHAARRFQERLEKLYDIFPEHLIEKGTYSTSINRDLSDTIYKLQNFTNGGFEREMALVLRNRVISLAKNPLKTAQLPPGIEVLIPDLQKIVGRIQDRIAQLGTLKTEVFAVIDSAASGNKAYDRLIELGIDLAGFEAFDQKSRALMVQNFSVDVSILNGSKEGN